uniref:Uncharacterized protein n=1 Tax=Nelumbo nucifera TaxID=4432 RepID=A0A822Y013_NELNU|nr:TPA_asm: hypothetical protein HUJ06_026807 [Nelumbo nucifera]
MFKNKRIVPLDGGTLWALMQTAKILMSPESACGTDADFDICIYRIPHDYSSFCLMESYALVFQFIFLLGFLFVEFPFFFHLI